MIASDGRKINFITAQEQLDSACDRWSQANSLAIDTEFVRTDTFYPKPGLLQLADSENVYLIDPLEIESWDAFLDILQNPEMEFVLHSAGEDLSLLLSYFGTLPARIFDTQLAAAYAGMGFSLSYQALVELTIGITVPKEETRSDWLQRPLTDKQLTYAANDVCYLMTIRDQLLSMMNSNHTLDWFAEDSAQLLEVARKQEDPDSWKVLYADISNAWRLDDTQLKALQVLAYWRETEARRRDKPRNWIARDNDLFALASAVGLNGSLTSGSLAEIEGLGKGLRQRYGKALLELLADPPALTPIDVDLLNPPLPPRYRGVLKSWRKIVEQKADTLAIAPELLARKKWMHELLKGFQDSGELNWQPPMTGWRQQELESSFMDALD